MNSIAGPQASALIEAPEAIIIMSDEHQLLSAKTICHWPANSRANDSTKHQARSNKTDHLGLNAKLSR